MSKFLQLLLSLSQSAQRFFLGDIAVEKPQEYKCGKYRYTISDDETATITSYSGDETNVSIPKALHGITVTAIGYRAFKRCENLTAVTIPDSITTIGAYAFTNCNSLTTITIPNSVTKIGNNPFRDCENLTDIIVSSEHPTLRTIDGVLFDKAITKIIAYPCALSRNSYTIPQGVCAIGDSAFYECTCLTSVSIPDSVTEIGSSAFCLCDNLTAITIPDSVTAIGTNPFEHCCALTDIIVSPEHPTLEIIDGVLFDKATRTLVTYPYALSQSSYRIPQSVCVVGGYAFSSNRELANIVIPDSVTTIMPSAFNSCSNLVSIILPNSIRTIGDSAFQFCGNLSTVTLSNSITAIDTDTFSFCDSLAAITIPDSVKTINIYAFGWCDNLTSVTLPGSITKIHKHAFDNCSADLTLAVEHGSYGERYAKANKIKRRVL